jgi:hypothetical protein
MVVQVYVCWGGVGERGVCVCVRVFFFWYVCAAKSNDIPDGTSGTYVREGGGGDI